MKPNMFSGIITYNQVVWSEKKQDWDDLCANVGNKYRFTHKDEIAKKRFGSKSDLEIGREMLEPANFHLYWDLHGNILSQNGVYLEATIPADVSVNHKAMEMIILVDQEIYHDYYKKVNEYFADNQKLNWYERDKASTYQKGYQDGQKDMYG